MRKFYLFICLLLAATWCVAQVSEIKITTSKEYGDSFDMWPKSTSKEDAIKVDWGDGEIKTYNIDPNGMPYASKVSSAIKGDTIRIFTQLVSLDCSDGNVTSLTLIDQPLLKLLIANSNELTTDKCVLDGAVNLVNVNLNNNQLTIFDMRAFSKLELFSASGNEQLSTVLFLEGSSSLKSISMSNCDISHFYPISLPNLSSLQLANGSLMDLELGEYYPELTSLNVSDNYISTIDVTKCSKLFTLNVAGNQLKEVNVTQNPELTQFYCGNNQIEKLNLLHNPSLSDLGCADNKLTDLNVCKLSKLTTLTCGGNQLKRLDLSNNFYLSRIYCNDNLLEFLDFAGNPNLDYVDCRNNSNMTACSLNYMFSTMMSRSRDAYSTNLLISGCNAETADTEEVNSSEMKWKTDVVGDASAVCDSVVITLQPSENGTYRLEQPQLYGKNYKEIKTKAMVGTPVKVVPAPDTDYAYKNVVVNDKEIPDTLFVVNEAAAISVNFKSTALPYMTLNVAPGTPMTFSLKAAEEGTEVTIDWGDGAEHLLTVGVKEQFIDGVAAGETVRIVGEITEADFASYPGVDAWDNQLTGIDVSHNAHLVLLSTYMNPIETLDVDNCPNLEYLDCAYCELSELNVAANSKLTTLICYGNKLKTLDVSHCVGLTEFNAKNNFLTELNLSANAKITLLDIQNNELQQIDVTHLKDLVELYANGNKLTEIDVANNEKLLKLAVSGNELSELNVSENKALGVLQCAGNKLQSLDLSNQELIYYVDCGGNGMSACALNDLYYSLPQYPTLDEPLKSFALWVKGDVEGATPNDAEHAESIIAKGKGWTINYEGDGTGCNEAYITIKEPENGKVRLFDNADNEIVSGGKVLKHSVVTVRTSPAEGYSVESVKANGKAVTDGTFTVERATEVVAKFILTVAIDKQETQTITVYGDKEALIIDSPVRARITIYSMDGVQICRKAVCGYEKIEIPAGTYVVTVDANQEKVSKAVIVY